MRALHGIALGLVAVACGGSDEAPAPPDGTWTYDSFPEAAGQAPRAVWAADGRLWAALVYYDPGVFLVHRSSLAVFDGSDWEVHDTGDVSPIDAVWAAGPDDVWLESTAYTEDETFDRVRLWRGDGATWEEVPLPGDLAGSGFAMLGHDATPWLVADRTVYGIEGDVVSVIVNLDDVASGELGDPVLCATDSSDLWIVGDDVLLRGEDLSSWSVVQRIDRSDLDVRAVTCTADAVWAWALRSGAPVLVRLDDETEVIDEGPSDDSWTSPLFQSRGAPLVLAPDDIWFVATRDNEITSELFEWELWHHDEHGSVLLDVHDSLPDSFEPQRLAPAPGGGVFIFDDLGTIARFTPDP